MSFPLGYSFLNYLFIYLFISPQALPKPTRKLNYLFYYAMARRCMCPVPLTDHFLPTSMRPVLRRPARATGHAAGHRAGLCYGFRGLNRFPLIWVLERETSIVPVGPTVEF